MGEASTMIDGVTGTFRLGTPNEATFTASDGEVVHLVTHSGAKQFYFCV